MCKGIVIKEFLLDLFQEETQGTWKAPQGQIPRMIWIVVKGTPINGVEIGKFRIYMELNGVSKGIYWNR